MTSNNYEWWKASKFMQIEIRKTERIMNNK
jgi:hypothetical protein